MWFIENNISLLHLTISLNHMEYSQSDNKLYCQTEVVLSILSASILLDRKEKAEQYYDIKAITSACSQFFVSEFVVRTTILY